MKSYQIEFIYVHGGISSYFIAAENKSSAMEKFNKKGKEFHSIREISSQFYNHQEWCVRL